jgi:hypothetical protein
MFPAIPIISGDVSGDVAVPVAGAIIVAIARPAPLSYLPCSRQRVAQLIAVSAAEHGLALVILLPLTYLAVRGIGRFRQLWAEPMGTREYRGWLNSPSLFPEWDERAT